MSIISSLIGRVDELVKQNKWLHDELTKLRTFYGKTAHSGAGGEAKAEHDNAESAAKVKALNDSVVATVQEANTHLAAEAREMDPIPGPILTGGDANTESQTAQ